MPGDERKRYRVHRRRVHGTDRDVNDIHLHRPRLSLAPPKPDRVSANLTGYYESTRGARPEFGMHINQAGEQLRLWFYRVLRPTERSHARPRALSMAGYLQDSGEFMLVEILDAGATPAPGQPTDGDIVTGTARGVPGALVVENPFFGGFDAPSTLTFRRRQRAPRLSDVARQGLEVLGGFDRLIELEWYRLTGTDVGWIHRAVEELAKDERLLGNLQVYLDNADDASRAAPSARMNAALRDIDRQVAQVFDRFHSADHRQVGMLLRSRMSATDVTVMEDRIWPASDRPHTKPMLQWLQNFMDRYSLQYGVRAIAPTLTDGGKLGLQAAFEPGAEPSHFYAWDIMSMGTSLEIKAIVGVGVTTGVMRISKVARRPVFGEEPLPPIEEPMNFPFVMGSVSLGLSVGVGGGSLEFGSSASHVPWRKADFPGFLSGAGFEAGASGGVGGAVSEDAMFAYGSNPELPRMEVSTEALAAAIGVEAHAEFGASWGWLGLPDNAMPSEVRPPTTSYDAEFGDRAQVHFAFDDAWLNPAARELMRFFCAAELKALSNPDTRLRIIGYTDTTAGDEHNLHLSRLRAQNALQVIKDILGDEFRAHVDEERDLVGRGEGPAREALQKAGRRRTDGVPDARFRKVEVEIDGEIRAVLQG